VIPTQFLSRVHDQSVVNVTMRPAAGAVGLVAHPAEGAWKSMQKLWAKEQEQYHRKTRVSDGVSDVKGSTRIDRETILEKFQAAKSTTKDRQMKYKDVAEKEMYGDQNRDQTKTDVDASHACTSTSSMETTTPTPLTSLSEQSTEGEDAAFERDLNLAKQISLAEQRGYERGLASATSKQ